MKIIDRLERLLQEKREAGMTNMQIAEAGGSTQQKVNALLNGRQKLANTTFLTALQIFPEVREVLEEHFCKGDGSSTQVGHAVNGNSNHVEGNITTNVSSPVDARLDAALDAVLADAEICDKCRLAVLRHIRAAAHS